MSVTFCIVAKRPNGQTAGCIKMPLGTEVGLGPGDIVLDGDRASPTKRGTAAPPPLFSPCLLWPNGRPSQLVLSTCYIYLKLGNSYRTNRTVIIQYLVLQCSLHNDYKYTVSGKKFPWTGPGFSPDQKYGPKIAIP